MSRIVVVRVFKNSGNFELVTRQEIIDNGMELGCNERPATDAELIDFLKEQLRVRYGTAVDNFHYVVE